MQTLQTILWPKEQAKFIVQMILPKFIVQMPRIYSGNLERTCVITWSSIDAVYFKQVLFTLGCRYIKQ